MSVPYTDNEASEARQWSNRYGPPNAWTASLGTAARMIGRLLDERERLMAKQTVAAPGDDYIREWHEEFQRWKAVAEEKQDFRDHFAAAALTGLLFHNHEPPKPVLWWVEQAFDYADAMLRERAKTNHDAAPAAIVPEPEPEPAARRRPAGGTGDTVHGAAPAARASVDSVAPQPTTRGESDRNDKAAPRPSEGTGDTPAAHATPGDGSERRECTEPVAWAVMLADGERIYDVYATEEEAKAIDEAVTGNHGVVPLYRSPTLTDAEAETLRELRDEAAQYADEIGLCASEVRGRQRIIDGLLERLGGEK